MYSTHIKQSIKKASRRGFSLVEVLVSLGIFSIVITTSVGTLLVLIQANAKAQALQTVITNLQFAVDAMSRSIRTGNTYYCDDNVADSAFEVGNTRDCDQETVILFHDGQTNDRIKYQLDTNTNSIVRRERQHAAPNTVSEFVPITSPDIQVNVLEFYVRDTDPGVDGQPTITIIIEGVTDAGDVTETDFLLQTTVTQRRLDI